MEARPAGAPRAVEAYQPPFRVAQRLAAASAADTASAEYQRLAWDALRKSINGLVNKARARVGASRAAPRAGLGMMTLRPQVNTSNLRNVLPELFRENLVRGRGLLARSVLKSQLASPALSPVLAALVAVVNTKLPDVGALVLRRTVLQFRRAFRRNDKPARTHAHIHSLPPPSSPLSSSPPITSRGHQVCTAATRFVAALVAQRVAHELLALEVLTLLLGAPTDDSVEVAVDFVTDCGAALGDLAPQGLHGVFERLRGILHEGAIVRFPLPPPPPPLVAACDPHPGPPSLPATRSPVGFGRPMRAFRTGGCSS